MLLLTFILIATAAGLLAEESTETDSETSRKVLGSSVVTSVSVIMDTGNGSKAVFADAVGKPVTKPTASQLASPINLLNPDRYEFYTFDDSGDLIKRLMTLEEIQGIIASGDGDGIVYNPHTSLAEESTPEKKVDDVVNNVQNVLKEEMETHKTSESKPMYDTPDVSSSWTMILPAIFGNSGEEVTPDRPLAVATPETIVIEPTADTTTIPEKNTAAPVSLQPSSLLPVKDYVGYSTLKINLTTVEHTDSPLLISSSALATSLVPPKPTTNKKPIISNLKKNQTSTKIPTSVKPPLIYDDSPALKDNAKPSFAIFTNQPNKDILSDFNIPTTTWTPTPERTKLPVSSTYSSNSLPAEISSNRPTTTLSIGQTTSYTTQNAQTESQTLPYFTQIIIDKLTSLSSTLGNAYGGNDVPSTFMTTQKIESTTVAGVGLSNTFLAFDTNNEKISQTSEDISSLTINATATEVPIMPNPELDGKENEASTLSSVSTINAHTTIFSTTSQTDLTTPYIKQENYADKGQNYNEKPDFIETTSTEKLAVTELLDQLLLTSTNIYQLNSELTETSIPIEDQRFETSENPSHLKAEPVMLDLQTTTPMNNNSKATVTESIETSPSFDQTMTEQSVISSIEQLLSQAMGTVEEPIDVTRESEKVQEMMASMNTKNISQVQSDAATLMSNIIGNPTTSVTEQTTTTTVEPDLSESFGSLISQIVGINIPSLTTLDEIPTSTDTMERNEDVVTVPDDIRSSEINRPATISEQNTYPTINKETYSTTMEYTSTETVVPNDATIKLTSESVPDRLLINVSSISEEDRNQTKPAKADLSLEAEFQKNKVKYSTSNEVKVTMQPLTNSETNKYNTIEDEITVSSTPYAIRTTDKINLEEITSSQTIPIIENSTFAATINLALDSDSEVSTFEQTTTNNPNNYSATEQYITDTSSTDSVTTFTNNNLELKHSNATTIVNQGETTWALVPTIPPHSSTPITTRTPQENSTTINPEISSPVDLDPQFSQPAGLEGTTSTLDTDIYKFVELCNELSFGFWKSVTSGGISSLRSVVVSPFAATSLLAMVFLGARGATSGEMNEILKLDDMVTFNPHMIFRNVSESIEVSKKSGVAVSAIIRELYSDKNKGKLLNFYKERARQFYDGHVEEANFKEIGDVIRRRTNLLVKRYTWGKIPEYLKESAIAVRPPLAGVSVSIFQTDCSAASTENRDGELHFVVLPSVRQRRLVPIPAAVWRSNFLAGYEPGLDATVVSIGSTDQLVSTIFVMPGQQGIAAPGDGLARLEERLLESAFKDGSWTRLLKSLIPRSGLEVQIPRFSHKSVINATSALQRMGLKDLFNSDKADLRGLNGVAHELYLSDMLQINNFATCGEGRIDDTHHIEFYPAVTNRSIRAHGEKDRTQSRRKAKTLASDVFHDPMDYQRAFADVLYDPGYLSLPLPLRPRQARIPEAPRLRFDRPFLYFVRHNPTGLVLHMGRFNPRLLP